jgi:hypothetical protein
MRLRDIDDEKGNPAAILIVEIVQGGYLPPERRSSVAAEDKDHRLLRIQVGQTNSAGFIQFSQ